MPPFICQQHVFAYQITGAGKKHPRSRRSAFVARENRFTLFRIMP
jgi:hypothetical protein